MIWLHAHPSPPSPVSKLSFILCLPVCRRSSLLTGEGASVEPKYKIERKLGPLQIVQSSLGGPVNKKDIKSDKFRHCGSEII
jgi:hypothetical protein